MNRFWRLRVGQTWLNTSLINACGSKDRLALRDERSSPQLRATIGLPKEVGVPLLGSSRPSPDLAEYQPN